MCGEGKFDEALREEHTVSITWEQALKLFTQDLVTHAKIGEEVCPTENTKLKELVTDIAY